MRVHEPAGAALQQGSAEDTHVVLGTVRGMGVVAELLGTIEAKGIGAGGFHVGAEAAGAGDAGGAFALGLCVS